MTVLPAPERSGNMGALVSTARAAFGPADGQLIHQPGRAGPTDRSTERPAPGIPRTGDHMPTMRRLSSLLAVTALLAVALVSSPAAGAPPIAAPTIAVTPTTTTPPTDRGVVIEVPRQSPATVDLGRAFPRGTVFSVALYENPSTGYQWIQALSVGRVPAVVLLDTDLVYPDITPMPGMGGTRYFRYQAVHRGSATITLRYQRPWEATPVQQVTLRVRVR